MGINHESFFMAHRKGMGKVLEITIPKIIIFGIVIYGDSQKPPEGIFQGFPGFI